MDINLQQLLANGYSEAQIGSHFSNHSQELILLPTEKCNFRCSYCYEDFKIGKMPPWLVESIKCFIAKRCQSIKQLNLSWFGGEPLLARKICLDIIQYADKLCTKHQVNLYGSFTTNGYLLDNALVAVLSQYNHANFQVTLDGYGENHNTTRVLANGRGTFAQVWSNILSLKASDISFTMQLRLHITESNYASMREMVQQINKHIGADNRFGVHFHNISNLGGPNKGKIKVLDKRQYTDIIHEFEQMLTISSNSEVSLHQNRSVCYAAKPNSLLVRANGRIGKCTVAFDNPANDIGRFLADGRIEIDNDKLKPWMYGYDVADPEVLSCPIKGVYQYNETKNLKLNVV